MLWPRFGSDEEGAATFPLIQIPMFDQLGYSWGTTVLAFLTVAIMPSPWLFFKYGKFLRSKSKFASTPWLFSRALFIYLKVVKVTPGLLTLRRKVSRSLCIGLLGLWSGISEFLVYSYYLLTWVHKFAECSLLLSRKDGERRKKV